MDFQYLQSSSLWCLTLTDTTGGKAERCGAGGGLGHVTAFATLLGTVGPAGLVVHLNTWSEFENFKKFESFVTSLSIFSSFAAERIVLS